MVIDNDNNENEIDIIIITIIIIQLPCHYEAEPEETYSASYSIPSLLTREAYERSPESTSQRRSRELHIVL